MDKTLIALSLIGGSLLFVCVFFVASVAYAPNNVYTPEPASIPAASLSQPITFVFGGDVMLGRKVNYEMHQRNDFSFPFVSITPIFAGADAVLVNLESPLYEPCPVSNASSMTLCASPESARALARAGVTLVSFANNHMRDYGAAGIAQTNDLLAQQGIGVVNNGKVFIREVRGYKVGLIAYNLTWGNVLDSDIRVAIEHARSQVDMLIASFHWGDEYTDEPNAYQKRIAHAAIDAGADVVIGSHPHHVQPIGQYKGKYIFYSLGNLIFDQMWSEKTRIGALIKFVWNAEQGDTSYEIIPTKIFDFAQPQLLGGADKQAVIDFMTGATLR